MGGQLSVIQNVLNPGKQVSKITCNQFSLDFLFLWPHILVIPSGHLQRAEGLSSLNTTMMRFDRPVSTSNKSPPCVGRISSEKWVPWVALNTACTIRAQTEHIQKTSPEDLPLSYLEPFWTLGKSETCHSVQPLAFEFTR